MSDETQTQAPEAPAALDLDAAVAGFISETEAEYRAADLAPTPDPGPEGVGAAAEPQESPVLVPPNPTAQAPVAPGPPSEAVIAAAVAQALEAARLSHKAREAEEARTRAEAPPGDEIEALRRLGYDPDMIVRKVLAARLGDKAPKELQDTIRQSETQKQISNLEQRVISQQRELAARQYFDTVATGAKTYLATGEYGKDAPTVAAVAKKNPDRVHAEVMQELISDARARAQREPNGEVMPYSEAVKRVEKRWAEYQALFSPVDAQASTTTSPTMQAPGVPVKPTPKTVVKPPDRPLAPWLQRGTVEETGLRAAVDEFKRVELSRKP